MRSISIDFETSIGVTLTITLMQHAPNSHNMGIMWTQKDGTERLEERELTFDEFETFWAILAEQPQMPDWNGVADIFSRFIVLGK